MKWSDKLVHVGLSITFGLLAALFVAISQDAPTVWKMLFWLGGTCSAVWSALLGFVFAADIYWDISEYLDTRN